MGKINQIPQEFVDLEYIKVRSDIRIQNPNLFVQMTLFSGLVSLIHQCSGSAVSVQCVQSITTGWENGGNESITLGHLYMCRVSNLPRCIVYVY
jgi:hypothetical protein